MILRELSELPGVSGDEGLVRERIWQAVRDMVDGGKVDPMGNLITWKGVDKPGPRLMIAAHMDEVGLMVTHVDRDGLLRFKKVGGIDDRVLPAKAVHVGPGRSRRHRRQAGAFDEARRAVEAHSLQRAVHRHRGHFPGRGGAAGPPGAYVTFATEYAESWRAVWPRKSV